MKWYCRIRYDGDSEDSLLGPYLCQADALASCQRAKGHGAAVVNAAFEAADNYPRIWRPLEIAVVTRNDGLWRVMNDGTEHKIEG